MTNKRTYAFDLRTAGKTNKPAYIPRFEYPDSLAAKAALESEESLISAAAKVEPVFINTDHVSRELGAANPPKIPELKGLDRATVIMDSIHDGPRVIEALGRRFDAKVIHGKPSKEDLASGQTILAIRRNTLDPDKPPDNKSGYRDILMNLHIGGHIHEIQANVTEMLAAKKLSHPFYVEHNKVTRRVENEQRKPTQDESERISQLDAKQQAIHAPAWARALALASEKYSTFSRKSASEINVASQNLEALNIRGSSVSQAKQTQSFMVSGISSQSANSVPSGNLSGSFISDTSTPIIARAQDENGIHRGARPIVDTRSDIMATANDLKEERKARDWDVVQREREERARAWSPEQAAAQVKRDIVEHQDYIAAGKPADAYYLRGDMWDNARWNPHYDMELRKSQPELHARVQAHEKDSLNVTVDVQKKLVREHDERDRMLAMRGLNEINLERPKGKELERDEFIVPRRIANTYTEVDGKFYARDSNRLMFEDKGQKLATSTTDKQAIADMVTYAKAKQWDSLKLSGPREFRREAWLQAESQGIKTQGYTPKAADLAALQSLTQERQANAITPVQDRQRSRADQAAEREAAPRHDLAKDQAALHEAAAKNLTRNMEALRKNPALENHRIEDIQRLAYWRGIAGENHRGEPQAARDEALARFDRQAADPRFLERINEMIPGIEDNKAIERGQKTHEHDTHEHSL
ncbi:MAG: hypothetical protein LBI87_10995 [Candidatus Accumulibacter sp.]|nr:hypothetical protein [Accumulibacter sp.]